uniref:WRKY transcription factor n=1 Tax=Fagopyrum tataricum TaxID=62330 RepID=A0A4P9Q334_FAGTA|nr:WRKY transcription factor [Fagopyrum tataricum]
MFVEFVPIHAEPSPTTGSFFKPQMAHTYGGSTMFSSIIDVSSGMNENKSSCFEFQPISTLGSNFVAGLSVEGAMTSADMSNKKSEQGMQVQAQCSSIVQESSPVTTLAMENDFDKTNQNSQPQHNRAGIAPVNNERVSEDGYIWRKYGQKLVKGSEYPRSYYKCTHPTCEVKKLFECAPDGQITDIIYKGTHDHPMPQPTNRTSASSISIQEEQSEKFSSAAGQADCCGAPELLPCAANEMTVEDGVSQLNRVPDDIDVDDDPFAKRRKMENDGVDINNLIRPIREPRVVVQTLSEVDILDDGYRWRKYGQKVVRGNPNPRSYYKCTSVGCPVRKHVERAPHDPKAVITTYEGKHNHDVPIAKTSIHDTIANPTSRVRQHDGETVSLDLGVGMSSNGENAPNQPQLLGTEPMLGQDQIRPSNLLFLQAAPNSTYPGYIHGAMMMYGSSESRREGFDVRNLPLNHPANAYPPSIARLLMGP